MNPVEGLKGYVREIRELEAAAALAHWDQRTYMPPRGLEARAQVVGRLKRLAFERLVSPKLDQLLKEAEAGLDAGSELDRALVRHWRREHDRKRAIPPDLYQKFVETCSRAEAVWEQAKAKSDFAMFAPHLGEVVGLVRKLAELLGYEEHPYDALLEEYEPGMGASRLKEVIEPLRAELVPLLQRLKEGSPTPARPAGPFPVPAQRALARKALELIGYDFSAGRLDDSVHPFTVGLGPGDVRVTNRYSEDDPFPGLFAALHEGGHALYDQGVPRELAWTGLDSGASFGVHESQSRLWENQIGRSLPFWQFFHHCLVEHLPAFRGTGPEEVWRMVCEVRPSPVRVEADEVTYNLHIALRFELELALIEGRLSVERLPERWNQAMESYLGIIPPDDARGVLQDVHWSGGMFGYFPSYMLGNLYAAQLMAAAEHAIPDLWDKVASGDMRPLLAWLREEVHAHGRIYPPEELMKRATGEGLTPRPFLDYLKRKYDWLFR
ncbi:carboxypeptidase M32 [Candidatus Bipolaricaulota bacterium]|nr:carboxypeptidase M32 [Candidatus Bipolaricaulota bacterium]